MGSDSMIYVKFGIEVALKNGFIQMPTQIYDIINVNSAVIGKN